jgi:phage-related protein
MTGPMGGASGNEIGRVSVRVVPDITGFRKKVKKDLKAEMAGFEHKIKIAPHEESLKKFAGKVQDSLNGQTVTANAVLGNPEGFQKSVDDAAKGLEAEVPVGANTDEAEQSIDRFKNRYLNKFSRMIGEFEANIPLTIDGEELRRDLKADEKAFKELLKKIKPKLDDDTLTGLRRQIDEFYLEVYERGRDAQLLNLDNAGAVQRAMKAINKFTEMDLDLKFKVEGLEKAAKDAKAASDAADVLIAKLQKGFVRNEFSKLFKEVFKPKVEPDEQGAIKRIKGLIAKIKAQVELADVNVPVGVDVDQGSLDKATSSIRAAFSKLRNIKVNTSTDSGGDADGEKTGAVSRLTKSISGMGSAARGAVDSLLQMRQAGWIVIAIFTLMAPVIGLVAGLLAGLPSLLLMFGAGAGAVALGLDGIKKAASTLTPEFEALKTAVSETFESRLTPIFDQLRAVFPALTSGMQQVAGGLADMFQGFTGVVTSSAGIAKISTILEGIGNFFTGMQPVIATWTSAFLTLGASGAQAFGTLLAPLQSFANGFNEVVARVASNGVFEGAMQGMAQTLTGFFDLFNRLFEAGLQSMAQLGPALQNMFMGFGDLLTAAMPALTALSAGLANLIGSLGSALAPGFAALAPVVSALMPIFTQLATVLGQTLSTAVAALAPALTAIANTLGPVLTTAVTALAPILTQVAQTLGTVLLAAVTALAPVLPQLTAAFVAIAVAVSQGLAQALPVVAQAFIQLLPSVVQLIPAFLQIVQALIPLIPAFFQVAAAVIKLVTAFTPLINVLARVVAFVAEVIAVFAGLAANIVAKVAEMASGVVSAFAGMISTVLAAIGSFVGEAVNWFQGLGPKISAACSGFSTILIAAGKALMDGLLSGIRAGAEAVFSFVSGIAGKIAALKGPLPYDKKVLIPNGKALMEGLNTGLEDGAQDVYATVKTIAKAIMEAMKEVFGIGLGVDATGVTSGMSAVESQMKSVASSATDFKQSMDSAAIPDTISALSVDDSKAQRKLLDERLLDLEIQRKTLELAKGQAGADQAAIKAQLEQIKNEKLQLGLQKDKLTQAEKYGAAAESTGGKLDQLYKDIGEKVVNLPTDFAKATGQQFLSDIGISGQGAIPQLLEQGSQFIFQVANMDTALSAQQTLQRRQGMGVVPR